MTTQSTHTIAIAVDPSVAEATITDSCPEIVSTVALLTGAQRRGFVTDAWTTGVRALLNAHRAADRAQQLVDVGKSMLKDFDRELNCFVTRQRNVLKEGPPSGGELNGEARMNR